jgi:transposase
MAIVVGLDIHREQVTFDALDDVTGEVRRGRIAPAGRLAVRRFLASLPAGQVDVALEATTGWRFIVEEALAVGATAHLAEPAETANLRGRKARAKTDRADARHLRELLQQGRLPEAWVPPEEILELRQRVRLRKTLVDERTAWQQRIHALLFHHGVPRPRALLTREGRGTLERLELSASARETLEVALAMIGACDAQLAPLDGELRDYARRQAGCRALMGMFGVGPLTSAAILAELGDARRFSSSRHAVRFAGLDVTVYSSDARRSPGRLSRQGSSVLRWAVYEAAQTAARPGSPDHCYYLSLTARLGKSRAKVALARKLLRRPPHPARARRRRALPRDLTRPARAPPSLSLMIRGRLPKSSCRSGPAPAAPDRPSGRAHTFGITRFTISSPTRSGSSTKIRSGARAQPDQIAALAHGPPDQRLRWR